MGFFNKLCGVLSVGVVLMAVGFFPRGSESGSPPPDDGLYEPAENVGGVGNQADQTTGAGSGTASGSGTNETPPPFTGEMGEFDAAAAISLSESDNAAGGYCARGVANIAEAQGLGNFRGMNAHDFPTAMASQGWVKLEGYNASNAPVGSILTFNSDVRMGNAARNSGGGTYGHVEFVGTDSSGSRTYISDTARSNWGGSVADNFSGVWVKSR